jgi:hypothetical protein
MAPVPARTAAHFHFYKRIGDSYQHWNPLTSALQSHDTASLLVPATPKSKNKFMHQDTFRQLVNGIGKLVWIAKLDASKGDIEQCFLPKALILKVSLDTIVPNPHPESSPTQKSLSQPSLTPSPILLLLFLRALTNLRRRRRRRRARRNQEPLAARPQEYRVTAPMARKLAREGYIFHKKRCGGSLGLEPSR